MKKIALLVSMALVMGSVACGGDKPAADPSNATTTTAAPTDPSAPAAPTDTSAAPAAPATPAAPTK